MSKILKFDLTPQDKLKYDQSSLFGREYSIGKSTKKGSNIYALDERISKNRTH